MASQMKKSNRESLVKKKIRYSNGFSEEITKSVFTWLEHISAVDLSNKNLTNIEDTVKFPPNLVELNLSNNRLTEIPVVVHNLEKLKNLDISHNKIKSFDETPSFCNAIKVLNLSYNCLCGPPCWIWTHNPARLKNLDLSFNIDLTKSFKEYIGVFNEMIQYETPVTDLKINNCCFREKEHLKILKTFPKAKVICMGSETLSRLSMNQVVEVPCIGLETCCDIQSLNLSNTNVYTVNNSIDIFTSLVEINLSQNYIWGLPNEICNLHNLETCILSDNSLLYLPDDIGKLQKLVTLRIDGNKLCMLPDSIIELMNLEQLDIYDNCLYEIPEKLVYVAEVDYAQNYFDEPDDPEYIKRKTKMRYRASQRYDGRKIEQNVPESEHTPNISDDESYFNSITNSNFGISEAHNNDRPSSPEDWDSDEYWEPQYTTIQTQSAQDKWLNFVKKKMDEGNFCPMDAHTVPIAEKVKYEKQCRPKTEYESDGQFDDFSEDDS